MATAEAAILPLVHNIRQTHTSLEETEQTETTYLLHITSNVTQLQYCTTEYYTMLVYNGWSEMLLLCWISAQMKQKYRVAGEI